MIAVIQESVKIEFSMKFPGISWSQGRFSYIFCNEPPSWRSYCLHSNLIFIWKQAKCIQLDSNFIANNLRKQMGLRHFFLYQTIFSLINVLHLGRHLEYIEMLNDARVASLGFFKDNVCTTRINKEKKFKIKFQVLLNFAQILSDYLVTLHNNFLFRSKIFCRIL